MREQFGIAGPQPVVVGVSRRARRQDEVNIMLISRSFRRAEVIPEQRLNQTVNLDAAPVNTHQGEPAEFADSPGQQYGIRDEIIYW